MLACRELYSFELLKKKLKCLQVCLFVKRKTREPRENLQSKEYSQ